MNKSEQLNELGTALAKAQNLIKDAAKNSINPFYKSSYADLSSVWESCREALNENGLSIAQTMGIDNGQPTLETTLLHSSGQFICGTQLLEVKEKNNPQALGSAITYARRYGLAAIVGIVADEDDDGETHRTTQSPTKQQPKPSTATTEPEKAVQEELQKAGVESEVESVEKIPQTAVEFYNWLLTLPKGKTQNKTWFLKVTGTKEEELATPDGVRHAYDWMQEHLKGNYEKT